MDELTAEELGRVRPLFQSMDHHMAIHAVLDGTAQARVFVDERARPRAALAWSGYRFYLAGTPCDGRFTHSLRRFFADTVRPAAISAGQPVFILYYAPLEWQDSIRVILAGQDPQQAQRHYYLFSRFKQDRPARLPDGFRLRLVDERLLAEGHLRHLNRLTEEMCSERPSVADFLARSFGVCLVDREQAVAAWCLSEYNSGEGCEVGIETIEEYRRQGLGTIVASALIEHAAERGVTRVGWDCWAGNQPSVATALHVGFEKVEDYPVYYVVLRAPAA